MGRRVVRLSQCVDVEIKATVFWPSAGTSGHSYDEDPREVDEITGEDAGASEVLAVLLEHGYLSEDELQMAAIEAHDDICRWEHEQDGYQLALDRVRSAAGISGRDVGPVATAIDAAANWREYQQRKHRALFRERAHEMEEALEGQEPADDPEDELRLFLRLAASPRVLAALRSLPQEDV